MLTDTDRKLRRPIRTRGPFRPELLEELAEQDFRGTRSRNAQGVRQRSVALSRLVSGIRRDVGGHSLSVVIHGWGSPVAYDFCQLVAAELEEHDSVWLVVPESGASDEYLPPDLENAVVLAMGSDRDRRIWRNMVADIVFYPASAEGSESEKIKTEKGWIAQWRGRARIALLDQHTENLSLIVRAGSNTEHLDYRLAMPSADAGSASG